MMVLLTSSSSGLVVDDVIAVVVKFVLPGMQGIVNHGHALHEIGGWRSFAMSIRQIGQDGRNRRPAENNNDGEVGIRYGNRS